MNCSHIKLRKFQTNISKFLTGNGFEFIKFQFIFSAKKKDPNGMSYHTMSVTYGHTPIFFKSQYHTITSNQLAVFCHTEMKLKFKQKHRFFEKFSIQEKKTIIDHDQNTKNPAHQIQVPCTKSLWITSNSIHFSEKKGAQDVMSYYTISMSYGCTHLTIPIFLK